METTGTSTPEPERPKLLDRVRDEIRRLHYSSRTERAYVSWIRQYILYHGKRHPDTMGEAEITGFLTHLAARRNVSASTQNQALSALLFLYRRILGKEIGWLADVERAQRPARLPVVLTVAEVRALLSKMTGPTWLMASLLYGSGLRRLECCRLRVKDIDLERREITVRHSKGQKDRTTVLPARLIRPLRLHFEEVRKLFDRDVREGAGHVELPYALARKYPGASREWGWQWVFPATRTYVDRRTGERRRHHLHETVLQRAVQTARRAAGIVKPAGCHALRHYAGCRIMPGGIAESVAKQKIHGCVTRHNHKLFRKTSRRSPGRKRPTGTLMGAVLASAASFSCRSAWRYIWVVSTDSCPSQRAMTERSTPC
jgi:integron integrase